VEFEILWSTRSAEEFDTIRRDRAVGCEWLPTEGVDWWRVLDVQERLWSEGRMRAVPLPDLLVAALAERHGVTVVHYDADYDAIATITARRRDGSSNGARCRERSSQSTSPRGLRTARRPMSSPSWTRRYVETRE